MALSRDESRDGLIQILDSFTCGVLAEVDRKIVFANQRACDLLGYPRDGLWGRTWQDLVPQELYGVLEEEGKLVEQGDLRARLLGMRRRDGTAIPVLVLPMAEFEGESGHPYAFSVLIDLGAVMTARQALYEGEDQLRTALTRIAVELQSVSLLAGGTPAAHPDLQHPALAELSKREREVLAELLDGERVPSIARKLSISPHTVRNHLKSMFRKLEVGSQTELIQHVKNIG